MWKLLIAASTLLSTGYGHQLAESQFGRFLASLSTVTSTSYLTTMDTCTFSTSCADIDDNATACRRRRRGLPIGDVEPSATIP